MLDLIGTIIACLFGGSIVGWYITDGIVERRERKRYQGLFMPLISGSLRFRGQQRDTRYEVVGNYRGHRVTLYCPVISLFNRSLRVTGASISIQEERVMPDFAKGQQVKIEDKVFFSVGGRLQVVINPPLTYSGESDSKSFLDQVGAELDNLIEVAGQIVP